MNFKNQGLRLIWDLTSYKVMERYLSKARSPWEWDAALRHYHSHPAAQYLKNRGKMRRVRRILPSRWDWDIGRRRSNSSRRCRLHSRALSPLPFAVAATTAAGAAAHRRLHFRRPSPVLHPRRSPVTAATASGGAAASTHASSGGTVSNGQGYACDSFLSVDFPAIWAYAWFWPRKIKAHAE